MARDGSQRLMLFVELRFAVFFVAVFCVYWAVRNNRIRKVWLLGASYFFYGAWDWRFLLLIFASTAIDFVAGSRIVREQRAGPRRAWLVASLAANLGILGFFKYFDFFVRSGLGLLELLGLPGGVRELSIVLPVGISFFTFQSMSYTVDIYRGRLRPSRSFVDFALFVSFFPQLVAGPIVRARGFLPQLALPRRFADVRVRACLVIFLIGYVKKACIADGLAVPVDAVFASTVVFDAVSHWLALALYSVQIYCDFSGYTDMAIGIAGLLGYELTENFRFPYLARSVRDFWRRWHISLSTWFRDYLYIPLGGNRGSARRIGFNLAVVYLLCGLWHGAAWTFVVWGAYHGALMLLERTAFGGWLAARGRAVQFVYLQLVLLLGWMFFRSADLEQALGFLAALFGGGEAAAASLSVYWVLLLSGLFLVHVANSRWDLGMRLASVAPARFALAYGALVALALPWVRTDHRPFIYFQF